MAVTEREGGGSHVKVSADMLVTGRVAQMGRGVMQDVARRMIGQMAQNMEALLAGGAPPASTGDAVSAGSLLGSVVADRAKRIFGSAGRVAARSPRSRAMRCSRSRSSVAACCATAEARVVGSYGSDQATFAWSLAWWPHAIEHGLHPLLTDLVYAPGRLEPGLDELHPGPGAAGLAADGGLRARAGLRRARAGRAGARGLVHVPPLPRARRRARRRRWQAASSSASAPTRLPRRSTTSISRSCSRSRWPASSSPATCAARSRTAASSCSSRSASLGVFATFLETLFWATLGGAVALGLGIAFTRGSERARLVPLPRCLRALAYGIALVVGSAVPLGRAGPSRSARHQRPRLRARPRQPARPDARDGPAARRRSTTWPRSSAATT